MASTSAPRKPEQDLSNVEFETSEDVEVVPTFQSMKLREELLRGIYAYGKSQIINKTNLQLANFLYFFKDLRNHQQFNNEVSYRL